MSKLGGVVPYDQGFNRAQVSEGQVAGDVVEAVLGVIRSPPQGLAGVFVERQGQLTMPWMVGAIESISRS